MNLPALPGDHGQVISTVSIEHDWKLNNFSLYPQIQLENPGKGADSVRLNKDDFSHSNSLKDLIPLNEFLLFPLELPLPSIPAISPS
ncbi:MAG: hypothetical protein AAFY71_20235 [Bacteroidota bacterium]